MKTLIQLILIGLVIMSFSRCYNSKKATEQVNKADSKFPEIVAKLARDKYPCSDLLKPDTLTTIKDSLIFVDVECPDTLTTETVLRTDTLNNVITKTIRVPVNMPIQIRTITKWYEDSAKLKLASIEQNKLIKENERLTTENKIQSKKITNKNKENWFWRIVAAVFIFLFIWRKWKQLTTINFK